MKWSSKENVFEDKGIAFTLFHQRIEYIFWPFLAKYDKHLFITCLQVQNILLLVLLFITCNDFQILYVTFFEEKENLVRKSKILLVTPYLASSPFTAGLYPNNWSPKRIFVDIAKERSQYVCHLIYCSWFNFSYNWGVRWLSNTNLLFTSICCRNLFFLSLFFIFSLLIKSFNSSFIILFKGRRHSRVGLLKVYMAASSIALYLSIVSVAQRNIIIQVRCLHFFLVLVMV